MINNDNKVVPVKNYIYLFLIIICSVFIVFYMYLWFVEYKNEQLATSVINDTLQTINYNEFDNYITENKDAIIYVSVVGDNKILKFEKKFKKIIEDNNLANKILYLNVTDLKYDKSIITSIPSILIFENGIVDSNYDVEANNYDVKRLLTYLEDRGVTYND